MIQKSKVLTEVEPHAPDLEAGLASHVLVLGHDPPPLVGGEVVQLQGGLREKRDCAVEEVVPRLVLKLGKEEVSDCVREMSQGFQDHTIQKKCINYILIYVSNNREACNIERYVTIC